MDREKILAELNGLIEDIEQDKVTLVGFNIQAEMERIDMSDFDERSFDHVDTGIRRLTVKFAEE